MKFDSFSKEDTQSPALLYSRPSKIRQAETSESFLLDHREHSGPADSEEFSICFDLAGYSLTNRRKGHVMNFILPAKIRQRVIAHVATEVSASLIKGLVF